MMHLYCVGVKGYVRTDYGIRLEMKAPVGWRCWEARLSLEATTETGRIIFIYSYVRVSSHSKTMTLSDLESGITIVHLLFQ